MPSKQNINLNVYRCYINWIRFKIIFLYIHPIDGYLISRICSSFVPIQFYAVLDGFLLVFILVF
jgi:hypothetical protein